VDFRDSNLNFSTRPQKTIKKAVSFSGIGIHSGKWVTLRLSPAKPDTGIQFKRSDIPESPLIPAHVNSVVDTRRSTTIGKQGFFVSTVEHLCAALKAYEVDNVLVEVSDQELPIGDGSAKIFVELLDEAQVVEQMATKPMIKLAAPVIWSEGDGYIIALPDECLRFSYSLHYPNSKLLQNQFYSHYLTPEGFKRDIAPCRTFSCYEEVQPLLEKGLIKGGSLENTIVVKDEVVLNQEGLRFKDEMARHKVLDMIGDFCLSGLDVKAHIIGHRTGHQANIQMGKEIRKILNTEELQCLSR